MVLTTDDLIKIEGLFTKYFDNEVVPIRKKVDSNSDKINQLIDMVADIRYRLDIDQLPFIEAKVDDNTRRIEMLERDSFDW